MIAQDLMHARILVVDNEPDTADSLGRLLTLLGYTTEVVTDSTQTMERLRAFHPDAVLLDIAMPKVCGYELAKQIRTTIGNLPLIALSGFADPAHREQSLQSGFDLHLIKPVSVEAIEEAITREVSKRRALTVPTAAF